MLQSRFTAALHSTTTNVLKKAKRHDALLTRYLERIAPGEELPKDEHDIASKQATELDEYKKDIACKIKAMEALAKKTS